MWNIVRLNSKYNIIDENFKLLSEQWFEKMEFSNENSPSANTDDVYVYALIDKYLHIIDPRTRKTIYTVGCNYYQPQRISNTLFVFGQGEVSYITKMG